MDYVKLLFGLSSVQMDNKMNCRGQIIPQYKTSKQLRKNPLWGKPDQEEFETIHVSIEIGSVCADCKRTICDKEIELDISGV